MRELSAEQRDRFFSAVKRLRIEGGDIFQQFTRIHIENQMQAHGVPAFLPWHREYLRWYELALQRIDSSVVLPYWDWSVDSQSPELSPVLGEGFFGGNGRSEDSCVANGTFAGWQTSVPDDHCLKRSYNSGHRISSWYSPEVLEVILTWSKSYDQFRTILEGAPHGAVHVNIGGDFSTMHAPNDPIFYVHHAFVDMLWHEWQQRNPSIANTYNGLGNDGQVKHEDVLVPFNVPVSQTFDTRSPRYCYFYSRYGTQVPSKPNILARRQDNQILYSVYTLLDSISSSLLAIPGLYISPLDRTTPNKIRIPTPSQTTT
ncbi:hypothetical protein DSO57_1002617 [Entomophthora muscae]|uniref:Uncharacterized protein n=1 Tax=Entomophthora muscae TaxID=34485 RepID=A0ACC2SY76_9FUNG|nr:hypothetical protein DSO57_1002617 [Entomophthora muscae]